MIIHNTATTVEIVLTQGQVQPVEIIVVDPCPLAFSYIVNTIQPLFLLRRRSRGRNNVFELLTGCERPVAGTKSGPLFMDDVDQKSCWGVTAWAVAGFAGVMALAWLFGGHEVVALVAAR